MTVHEARIILLNAYRNLLSQGIAYNKELIIKHAKLSLKEYDYMVQLKTLNFVIDSLWNDIFKDVMSK